MAEKIFEDSEGEVEVRLSLPENISKAEAKKNLIVECHPTALKVMWKSGGLPLLDASPLYEKVRSGDVTWYVDDRQVVITLQKLVNRKWPALTDKEALEKRFGPVNLPPIIKKPEGKDGANAMEARSKVERLLKTAQIGDLEGFKEAAKLLSEGKTLEDGKDEEREIAECVAEVKDGHGRGALHFAAHKGRINIVKYLLETLKLAVDPRDEEGETPLMLAAREGNLEISESLLESGADPSASVEATGAQAIHHAAGHGAVELVKLLVYKGADVNAQSDAGPPLLWACGHGRKEVVNVLLTLGADPSMANEDGVTSLLTAAAAKEMDIMEILVKNGADVNSAAGAGVTPLFVAANEGSLRAVDVLLSAGADPNALDEEGATPIMAAASQGYREVVDRLLSVTTPDKNMKEWTVEALLEKAEHPASLQKSEMGPKEVVMTENSEFPTGGAIPLVEEKRKEKGGGRKDKKGQVSEVEAKARGDASFKKKNYQEALDAYTQALGFNPENASILSNRSLCWMRVGQSEQALSDAREARKLRPDWSKACYREGAALRLMERYEEAAVAFFEGVQLDPNNMELTSAFQEAVKAGREAHLKNGPPKTETLEKNKEENEVIESQDEMLRFR